MKFSDMMHKRERDDTEIADPELPPEARTAPPVPEAPIRFGGTRSQPPVAGPDLAAPADVVPPATAAPTGRLAPAPLAAPPAPTMAPPSIHDVVAELSPRPTNTSPPRAAASAQQLDTSAWLDGINAIDDDLLPS